MELIYFNDYHYHDNIVAAIGQFDGLHLAHIELLKKAVLIAKEKEYKSAVITFDPHPDFILKKNTEFTYITPLKEKAEVISQVGIDYLIIIPFNMNIAQLEPVDFINNFLLSINVKEVVVGSDFTFGNKGKGKAEDIEKLSAFRLTSTIFSLIRKDEIKIGSTIVRDLLKEGKVDEVKNWLGRYYQVSGTVTEGRKIGRTLGLPTANLTLQDDFVIVKPGVYVVLIYVDGNYYQGIANIGHNPSFNYKVTMTLEVNLFNFEGDLYNKEIRVLFIKYIRDEIKFSSKEEFLIQIEQDKAYANEVFSILNKQNGK